MTKTNENTITTQVVNNINRERDFISIKKSEVVMIVDNPPAELNATRALIGKWKGQPATCLAYEGNDNLVHININAPFGNLSSEATQLKVAFAIASFASDKARAYDYEGKAIEKQGLYNNRKEKKDIDLTAAF